MTDERIYKTTLPAGTYFIGDPCYCIHCDEWSEYLEDGLWHSEDDEVHHLKGVPCFAGGTLYGDGGYTGSDGFVYPVDAGLIGATPMSLVDDSVNLNQLGRIVTFNEEFEVDRSVDGVITIGHIEIPTDDEEGEDDVCECCGNPL